MNGVTGWGKITGLAGGEGRLTVTLQAAEPWLPVREAGPAFPTWLVYAAATPKQLPGFWQTQDHAKSMIKVIVAYGGETMLRGSTCVPFPPIPHPRKKKLGVPWTSQLEFVVRIAWSI